MRADDLPGVDFISCDACRAPFNRAHPPMVMGLEKAGEGELIIALCKRCMRDASGADSMRAEEVSRKADATARLRPNRMRKQQA